MLLSAASDVLYKSVWLFNPLTPTVTIWIQLVARYHGTTAAPWYHFSTVPVPSALRYYLVPQYHNYCGSSHGIIRCWHTVTNIC